MKTAFVNIDSLVTINAQGAHEKIGAAMRDVGEIRNGAIVFDDVIRWIGPSSEVDAHLDADTELVDCSGKTVMPGFVDSHTHMVFAGSRSHEFARRLAGATYAEIAAEGGGILTTMRAVREADVEALLDVGDALLTSALNHGTTTAEIKSGYGLDTNSELRLLEAVGELQRGHEARVLGTFLGAHAVPPEWKHDPEGYVDLVINDMLPRVAEQGIASFCDVFVDAGFFTAEQGERILRAGIAHGLRPKIHADEIALVGASQMAARVGAISADHLEHSTAAEIAALRDAGVKVGNNPTEAGSLMATIVAGLS
jgi:imidazolonepropionase